MGKWNILLNLCNLETVNGLCKICNRYKDKFDINVEYGHYIVDGVSMIAVASLLNKTVKINPIIDDKEQIKKFYAEVEKIGAYIMEIERKEDKKKCTRM